MGINMPMIKVFYRRLGKRQTFQKSTPGRNCGVVVNVPLLSRSRRIVKIQSLVKLI